MKTAFVKEKEVKLVKGIEYEQWGMHLVYEDEHKKIYEQNETDSEYLVYKLYPGIEMMLCSFTNNLQWGGNSYRIPAYFQIAYSYNGMIQLELEKDRLSYCDPGDIYVIQNAKHSYHGKILTNHYRGFNLLVTPECLPDSIKKVFESHFELNMDQLYEKISQCPVFFKLKSFDQAVQVCNGIFKALIEGEIGMLKLKTIELLMLMQKTNLNQFSLYKYFSKTTIEKTKAIKEYMDQNFSTYMTINQLCSQFKITPTLFKNCFKKVFHHTPYEYLIKIRLAKAAEYLETSDKNVTGIALESGYENSSNFTRAFKNMYKVTPTQYRENLHHIEKD